MLLYNTDNYVHCVILLLGYMFTTLCLHFYFRSMIRKQVDYKTLSSHVDHISHYVIFLVLKLVMICPIWPEEHHAILYMHSIEPGRVTGDSV